MVLANSIYDFPGKRTDMMDNKMGGGEGALAIWRMKGKNNTADKFAVFNAQTCFLI